MSDTYARTVATALDAQRRAGVHFEPAWEAVMAEHPRPETWAPHTLDFMRDHMRAAYYRDRSSRGRMRVEADGAPNRPTRDSSPFPARDVPRCKSADGCDREATRGRFGLKWCERHGLELERIAGLMEDEGVSVGGRSDAALSVARERGAQHMRERAA